MPTQNNTTASRVGAGWSRAERGLMTLTVISAIIVMGLSWWTLTKIEDATRDAMRSKLEAVVQSADDNLRLWREDKIADIRVWSRLSEVRRHVEDLVKRERSFAELTDAPSQSLLRGLLFPLMREHRLQGYYVIDRDGYNIAANRNFNIAVRSVLADQPGFMERALDGKVAFTLPIPSDVPLVNKHGDLVDGAPTMFLGAPVRDGHGEVVAVLALRLDPARDFSRILQSGQMGKSGETYAVSRDGVMLSESRFLNDLIALGLVVPPASSILNVHVRDPGGNMLEGFRSSADTTQQPLTLMAQQVLSGRDGFQVTGYRDYRGVNVIGAWHWIEKMGIGLTTEINVDEAYEVLSTQRILVLGAGVLSAVLLMILAGIFMVSRRRFEEEAKRTQAILDGMVDGFIAVDDNDQVVLANPAAERLFEYSSVDLMGSDSHHLFRSSEMGSGRPLHKNLMDASSDSSLLGVKQDGTTFPVELAVSDLVHQGRPLCLSVVRDVSDRRQAEEKIQRSEKTLKTAQRLARLGSWSWVIETGELYWSDEIYRIFGLAPQQVDATYDAFLEATHPEDRTLIEQSIADSLESGEAYSVEHRIVLPSGEVRAVHELGEAEFDATGRPVRMNGTVHDITERKEAEQAKSEFVSTVSHELRTPLTAIHGSLGLLLGGAAGALTGPAKSLLDVAHNSSDRLVRLINDILDFEKLDADKMAFEVVNRDLEELTQAAITANASYGVKFDVVVQLAEQQCPGVNVAVDADRFAQVMANLLSNAIKFSPQGGAVDVRIEDAGDDVQVCVVDYGPGIPDSFKDKIFQQFTQADSSDTRGKGGTGLGLSISKAIVEKFGGQIGFETAENEGTTFHFTLPKANVAVTSEETAKELPHLLICEDDPHIAGILELILSEEGYTCDIALSALEAREYLTDGHYAAMTLDVELPDGNGLSFLRELRRDGFDLPIVMLSAQAEKGRQEMTGEAIGMVDWLTKPMVPAQLLKAVETSLDGDEGRSEKAVVLHVEDDPGVVQFVSAVIGEIAEVSAVSTLGAARSLLSETDFDLVILDIGLGNESGTDLLPELTNRTGGAVPVLVFSAEDLSVKITDEVNAVLVKSRTTNEQLISTIKSLLPKAARPGESL